MAEPKIMVFDIETSGNIVYSFQIGYNMSIHPEQILEERKVICICWKYVGEKKVYSLEWDKNHDDKTMLKKFAKEALKADALVGHNSDKFDIKWLKTRMLYHRLEPMTNIVSVDTLKLSRANFNFNSNKLGYITKFLGFAGKLNTGGLQLWLDIRNGSKKAMKHMVKYCRQDVTELENVFLAMLPHCQRLPLSLSVLYNGHNEGCPMCGGERTHKNGTYTSNAGKYQKYKCSKCGHVFKSSKLLK